MRFTDAECGVLAMIPPAMKRRGYKAPSLEGCVGLSATGGAHPKNFVCQFFDRCVVGETSRQDFF